MCYVISNNFQFCKHVEVAFVVELKKTLCFSKLFNDFNYCGTEIWLQVIGFLSHAKYLFYMNVMFFVQLKLNFMLL